MRECAAPFTNERIAAVRCIYAGKRHDEARWMELELLDSSLFTSTAETRRTLTKQFCARSGLPSPGMPLS